MHGAPPQVVLLSVPILLIASVVAVSLLGLIIPAVKRALVLNPYLVLNKGQVYRLLTAGWAHASISHLVLNMLSLYFFAGDVLRVLGVTRFLALYISAVVVGFIPTTLRYMSKPNYSSLGASGAISAVMFSAVLLLPNLKLFLMWLPIPVPGVIYAVVYLLYSMWQATRAGDSVDHLAHFGGAVYGALFTYAFEPARVERTLRTFF